MKFPMVSATFRHGIHPDENKQPTAHLHTIRMPFVERYTVLLSQHSGAPAQGVVSPGQNVNRGQLLAEPSGFVSTAVHSPVTGRILTLSPRRHPNGSVVDAFEIEADPYSSQRIHRARPVDPKNLSIDEFVTHVQNAGLVGMGGAAFPSHVKYKLPEGARCDHLVINGCECEPFLTCDHRVMVERPEDVIRGTLILAEKLGAKESTIGVEKNKQDAIDALQRVAGSSVNVVPLKVKYPQGAEKMLIKALFDLEVPAGKLPLDMNIVVNNVATMAALADTFDRGIPLIERVVTVAGPGVESPGNYLVPIGTSVRDVFQQAGLKSDTKLVVMGGPMMGQPLATLDVPVVKGTSGLLAFTEAEVEDATEYTCIRCSRCLEACAAFLNPSRLARLSRVDRFADAELLHALDCMECGACSFACPSNIPIVQLIRVAKAEIRGRQRKAKG